MPVEMPLNTEMYYVISAEEIWKAEMPIRVEVYVQKYRHTQRIGVEPMRNILLQDIENINVVHRI